MVKLLLASTGELGGRRASRRTRQGSWSPGSQKWHAGRPNAGATNSHHGCQASDL